MKPFKPKTVYICSMKTTNKTRNGIARGIKIVFLAILLQSFVLGISILLRANDLYPSNIENDASAAQTTPMNKVNHTAEATQTHFTAADLQDDSGMDETAE